MEKGEGWTEEGERERGREGERERVEGLNFQQKKVVRTDHFGGTKNQVAVWFEQCIFPHTSLQSTDGKRSLSILI